MYSQEVSAQGALVGVGAPVGAAHGLVIAGAGDAHGFSRQHVGATGGLGKSTANVSKHREESSCPNYAFAALGGYCEESLWLLHGEEKIHRVSYSTRKHLSAVKAEVLLARIMGKNDYSLGNQDREDI